MSSRIRESAIIELMSVGLTRYEASLYVSMLSFDSSNYDQLIEESDVPYGDSMLLLICLKVNDLLRLFLEDLRCIDHYLQMKQ